MQLLIGHGQVPTIMPEASKISQKTLFKYREGGRTVGSGRVATIIE